VSARRRFEEIYNAHAGDVYRYALRRTDRSHADDVVSEVFMIAWRRLEEVPAEPRGWLLGVARRVIANARRAEGRRSALDERLAGERAIANEPAEAQSRLAEALLCLSEADLEALTLIAWDGLSHREAAQVLGVREGTVAVRVFRARRRLARSLAARPTSPTTNNVPQEAQ